MWKSLAANIGGNSVSRFADHTSPPPPSTLPPPPALLPPPLRPPDIPIILNPIGREGSARPPGAWRAGPFVPSQADAVSGHPPPPPVPSRPAPAHPAGGLGRNRSVDPARPENPRKLVWCAQEEEERETPPLYLISLSLSPPS